MKTTKLFNYLLLTILGLSLTMVSCSEKDDDEPKNEHKDAFGDVFVKKVLTPQGAKYGLVFYAGGKGLKTCKVKSPEGKEYDLAEFWKGAGNLRRHPLPSDMKMKMPTTGKYVFTLSFQDGQSITLEDILTNVEIPAIKGVVVTHEKGSDAVSVSWEKVENANNYFVKLTDKDKNKNKPLFVNKKLTDKDKTYSFNKSTKASPGWIGDFPSKDETCYVMVVAVMYEEGVTNSNKDHNKQMNTVKPTKITW